MHIIHLTSELAPIAKVGGLGDVLHGLPKELQRKGHTVEILLPKYDCIHYDQIKNLKMEMRSLTSFDGVNRVENTIWSGTVDGLRILLIEPHSPNLYFSRGKIYGLSDDIERFCYFSRTALEYLFKRGKSIDVLHLHDWPTAAAALLAKEMYAPLGMRISKVVFTIHNLEHQGKCPPSALSRMGLRGDDYLQEEKMQDPRHPHLINLLKGGIEYADIVTTVSPNYEKEIKTAEGGCGLDKVLVKHAKKLKGILNGIDEHYWNPAHDPHLACRYETHGAPELDKVIQAKAENRKQLLRHLGMREGKAPLVASVTRLVPQKGPHLILHALERTLAKGGQFVLLGSSATPEILQAIEALQQKLSQNRDVALCLDKDEALAHLIFAAADQFIIPSIFEPCGLTQMIALRYGAIPIARKTGGLADTVFDIDTSSEPEEKRNGFTFDFPDKEGVNWALDRALRLFSANRPAWQALMSHAMKPDLSWKRSAEEYLKIYC